MKFSIDELLHQAISAHQAGRLKEAELIYKDILQAQPNNHDANHNLGVLYVSLNKSEISLVFFKRATQLKPNIEKFWISYIDILINTRQFKNAQQALKKAKRKGVTKNKLNTLNQSLISEVNRPTLPQSRLNILIEYCQNGSYAAAETLALSITQEFPNHPLAWKALGGIFIKTGRLSEALSIYKKYITLLPEDAEAHKILGVILKELGKLNEAEASYRQAIIFKSDYAEAHFYLSDTLKELGKLEEAELSYRQAIVFKSDYAEAYNNLGIILKELSRLEEAEASYRQAIVLNPHFAEAHNNLGNLLKEFCQFEKAEASYRQAIVLKPNYEQAHNNLNLCLNYSSLWSPLFIYQQHLEFEKQFGGLKVRTSLDLLDNKQPGDKLRIGYVSGDFKKHSVAYFFEPLLVNHNFNVVETFCYYNDHVIDAVTKRLITASNHWRSIYQISDLNAVDLIKNDKIDILVDLSGHTAKNRLLIFAQKPAPIQVTWLGYVNTTGLSAIDYRFTDIITDPIGDADELHSETLLRLTNGFQCYKGDETIFMERKLPQKSNGYITFGSFNNFSKVTPEIIKVWSKILQSVPNSHLILKNPHISHEKKQYLELFKEEGIPEDRIKLYKTSTRMEEHLKLYNAMDIGLDPFPFNGATTTCEALWMGVPVITLIGDRHVGRVGASILRNVGLSDFIAQDVDGYIKLAINMADNINYLQEIRQGLRERMQSSPLCDHISFTNDVENAYQGMWQKYLN